MRKQFKAAATDDTGRVKAIVATLDVVDADMDVTVPGAFGEQTVAMIHAHDWQGFPIGKGRVYEDGNHAIFEGQFNLDLEFGQQAYQSVRFMGDLQEWSYGYLPTSYSFTERDGKTVRVLEEVSVHEVSPVLIGAGVGTGTLDLKHAEPLIPDMKFTDEAEYAMAVLDNVTARADQIIELRQSGKLGADSVERLTMLAAKAAATLERLEVLTRGEPTADISDTAAAAPGLETEFLRYQRTVARLLGAT